MPYMKKAVPEKLRDALNEAKYRLKDSKVLCKSAKTTDDTPKIVLYSGYVDYWKGKVNALEDVFNLLGIDVTPKTGK